MPTIFLRVLALRIVPNRGLVQPMSNGRVVGPRRVVRPEPSFSIDAVQSVTNLAPERVEGEDL
jgi:hypothetical protein